jgi:glycerol-3-phosphate acyltransferase PlsY
MDIVLLLGLGVAGYLVGGFSAARLVGRIIAPGEDLSQTDVKIEGSDRPFTVTTVSATAISMREGAKPGCVTSLLDMAKVGIPALMLKFIFPEIPEYMLLFAFMGVVGHNYPVYHKFKGGRGLSPIMGGVLVIDWLALPITLVTSNVIGLLILKDIMLAYVGWLLLLIPWFWWRFDHFAYVAYAVGVLLLYLIASMPEIKLYFEFRRTGELDKAGSLYEALEHTDMGRPIKYMRKYGLIKEKTNPTQPEEKIDE